MHLKTAWAYGLMFSETEPGKIEARLLRLRPELFIWLDFVSPSRKFRGCGEGYLLSILSSYFVSVSISELECLILPLYCISGDVTLLAWKEVLKLPPVSPFALNTTYL